MTYPERPLASNVDLFGIAPVPARSLSPRPRPRPQRPPDARVGGSQVGLRGFAAVECRFKE